MKRGGVNSVNTPIGQQKSKVETQREKNVECKYGKVNNKCMTTVRSNLYVTEVPKAEERNRKGKKQYLKKILVEKFPKVMKDINPQIKNLY